MKFEELPDDLLLNVLRVDHDTFESLQFTNRKIGRISTADRYLCQRVKEIRIEDGELFYAVFTNESRILICPVENFEDQAPRQKSVIAAIRKMLNKKHVDIDVERYFNDDMISEQVLLDVVNQKRKVFKITGLFHNFGIDKVFEAIRIVLAENRTVDWDFGTLPGYSWDSSGDREPLYKLFSFCRSEGCEVSSEEITRERDTIIKIQKPGITIAFTCPFEKLQANIEPTPTQTGANNFLNKTILICFVAIIVAFILFVIILYHY